VQKLIVICLQCLSVKLYHIQACYLAPSDLHQFWTTERISGRTKI